MQTGRGNTAGSLKNLAPYPARERDEGLNQVGAVVVEKMTKNCQVFRTGCNTALISLLLIELKCLTMSSILYLYES